MTQHIHDERLFDCYLAERIGDRLDPPAAEHLADCGECARRYGELASFMDGLRSRADAETDALFPPERLRAQQEAIAARVAHLGHPARVIRFPRAERASTEPRAPRVAARWLAAAAAAGMFVGIGTAFFLESANHHRVTTTAALSRPAHLNASAQPRLSPNDDDRFLSELDVALDRPRTRALMPFDQLTPHVREVSNVR